VKKLESIHKVKTSTKADRSMPKLLYSTNDEQKQRKSAQCACEFYSNNST